MKKFISAVITIFALALLINACKNSSTNPPTQVNTGYFPNGDGTTYMYSVEKTDSTGTQYAGTRNTEYNGTSVLSGTTYQVQIDSMNISGIGTVSFSYFRKNDNGVFYFLDTTGLAAYIPDSLRPYISIDTEMRELLFPLVANSTWPVFKMSLHYAIINLTIIDVSAAYDGTENLTLHLTSGDVNKSAVKVKYTLSLQIPDPNNPLHIISSSYNAYAWFVDGIGAVQWQGNGAILNVFSGSGVDFSDTTTVVTQSLISYNVK
jgi:hypothetical protein